MTALIASLPKTEKKECEITSNDKNEGNFFPNDAQIREANKKGWGLFKVIEYSADFFQHEEIKSTASNEEKEYTLYISAKATMADKKEIKNGKVDLSFNRKAQLTKRYFAIAKKLECYRNSNS